VLASLQYCLWSCSKARCGERGRVSADDSKISWIPFASITLLEPTPTLGSDISVGVKDRLFIIRQYLCQISLIKGWWVCISFDKLTAMIPLILESWQVEKLLRKAQHVHLPTDLTTTES